MNNIFALNNSELAHIADELQKRINEGLDADSREIACIPTYIANEESIADEKVLVLDWGGTNFRAAIMEFRGGQANVLEIVKGPLSAKETKGFNQEKLHAKMAEYIMQLKTLDETVTKIGYCFSYPAASRLNGDAILLRWTKGIDIPDMIDKPVGELLMTYLNNHREIGTTFTEIKVVNDTVACLFAGLTERTPEGKAYDSYIGLIVGTGTNMAAMMPMNRITKLKSQKEDVIPVNLESGNFNPPHLTQIDNLVDAMSNNKGSQRFEKGVSGGYLGEVFKTVFINEKVKYNFDGEDLSNAINGKYNAGDKARKEFTDAPQEWIDVATWLNNRSAHLVAASLTGLTQVLIEQNPDIKNIYLAADGTVFTNNNYDCIVAQKLKETLPEGVSIDISPKEKMQEPNLIGAGIAVLSRKVF